MSTKHLSIGIAAALAVAASLTLATGCGKGGGGGSDPISQVASSAGGASGVGGGVTPESLVGGGSEADKKEAVEIFNTRCSVCHGLTGNGDGPGSAALDPKPRDFNDKSWQASVTDEHIEKIIVGGGGAVGKSFFMPPNLDLSSKTGVVAEIRAHVRTFGQ